MKTDISSNKYTVYRLFTWPFQLADLSSVNRVTRKWMKTERNYNCTQGFFCLMKISVLRRNFCMANFFLGKCPIGEISVTFRLTHFCLNNISPNRHFYKKIL